MMLTWKVTKPHDYREYTDLHHAFEWACAPTPIVGTTLRGNGWLWEYAGVGKGDKLPGAAGKNCSEWRCTKEPI